MYMYMLMCVPTTPLMLMAEDLLAAEELHVCVCVCVERGQVMVT